MQIYLGKLQPVNLRLHNVTLQDLINTVNVQVDIPPQIVLKLSTSDRFATV